MLFNVDGIGFFAGDMIEVPLMVVVIRTSSGATYVFVCEDSLTALQQILYRWAKGRWQGFFASPTPKNMPDRQITQDYFNRSSDTWSVHSKVPLLDKDALPDPLPLR